MLCQGALRKPSAICGKKKLPHLLRLAILAPIGRLAGHNATANGAHTKATLEPACPGPLCNAWLDRLATGAPCT